MNWNNPSKDKPGSQHCVVTLISVHGKKQGSVPERVTYAHANSYLEMKRPFPRVSHSVQLSKSVPDCLIVSQSVPKCPRAPHSVQEMVTYAHANSYLEMKRPFPRVSHSVQLSKSVPDCLIVSQSVPKCPRAPHSVQEMVTYAHANSYLEMWRPFPI